MTPKEKGKFLLKYFKDKLGNLDLSRVDLSDFEGNVAINGWKVGQTLFQDHQQVGKSIFQDCQKAGLNVYQDEQKAGGFIKQDEQKAPKDEPQPVEPDYKAEYKRMSKELCEANRKIEALMWALSKAMERESE